MRTKFFLIIVCLACQVAVHAQLSIGKPTADSSALLDLGTTRKGLLLPRLSQTQQTTIKAPGNGLLHYQSSMPEGFYHYKRSNPLSAWQPLMPYTLQQNLRLGNYSLLGSRLNNLGIVMDKGEVVIQTQLPLVSPATRSALTVYNGNWTTEKNGDYINLVSFKTSFGLNLFSMRLINNPFNYLGIYQNSTSGPMQRFLIGNPEISIGDPPYIDFVHFALKIGGSLNFNGNLDIGFEYVFTDYTVPALSTGVYNCKCSGGKMLAGGGGGTRDAGSSQDNVTVLNSGPETENTWKVQINNASNGAKVIRVYAICSRFSSF